MEVFLASPSLSFSGDINLDALTGDGCEQSNQFLPVEPGSADFNFNLIFQSSNCDSSDADELFSGGKLLPFFKTKTNSGQLPPSGGSLDTISESAAASGGTPSGRQSIWRFGRSSSLGSITPTGSILPFPLNRSRSADSFPQQSSRLPLPAGNKASSKKFLVDPNQRKTYYYSGSKRGSNRSAGGGVRITPVLNVPAPMVSRSGSGSSSSGSSSSAAVSSLFSYLLCSCGSEERLDEPEFARCNPTKRNGTSQFRGVSF